MPRLTSNKAQGILESLGISLVDDQDNMRDVMQIYTEVAERIKGISDVSRMEVYEGLAGKYHISRLTALLDDLGSVDSMYKSMYDSSVNSTGSAMDENEKYMKSLQARINLARVEVEKLALAFGDAFLTEGMIQGLKVFGDFLGVIAKFTEKFGALPAMFGLAGTALFMLSSRFRGLVGSIVASTGSLFGFTTATRASATAAAGAAASTNAFKISLRGLMAATGVGLVLVGVGAAMEALLGSMAKSREISEKIATDNKALMDSYSQNKDVVTSLIKDYEELEVAMQSNPDLETQGKYYKVQSELAGLMPTLSEGEDSYGRAIMGNASTIQSRIDLVNAQVEAEQTLQDIKDQEEVEDNTAHYEKEYEAKKKLAGLKLGTIQGTATNSFLTGFAMDSDTEIKNMQDVEAAIVHFQKVRQSLYDEGLTDKSPKVIEVTDTIDDITNMANDYQGFVATMNSAQAYLTSQYTANMDKQIASNENLNASTKQMATDIVYDLAKVSGSANEIKPITDIFSDISLNSDMETAMTSLDTAVSELKENTISDFSVIEDSATRTFAKLKDSIMDASGLKIDSPEWNSLSNGLDNYIGNLMLSEKAARDLSDTTGMSIEEARAAGAMYDESGESAAGAAEDVYALKTAIDHLVGVNEQQIIDSDTLIWQYETQANILAGLTEGTQAHTEAQNALNGTKDALLSMYPELFASDAMSLLSTEDKIKAIQNEVHANDILRAAMKASRDGQLTANEDSVLSSAMSTKAKIQHINQQILALDKLAQALGASSKGLSAASAAASIIPGNGALALSLKASAIQFDAIATHGVGIYQEQLAGLETTQRSYIDTLEKSSAVMGNTTTSANKNADAARKGADAAKKGAGAKDKQTKAEKEAAKANEESYKTITENNEAIEKAIFITNEYEKAIEKLTLAIQKQESITQKFPTYSREYQASLKKEIKLQEEKQKVLEKQAKSLEGQIKSGNIIRYGTNTVVTQPSSTTTKTVRELAGWDGAITSGYGMRRHPTTGKYAMHDGIDIDGKTGDRLDSNINGKVLWAGDKGNGLGKYVMIQAENGIKHIFGHLSKVAVKIGDNVATGMKLGEIGSTGRSTGSHLHYEVRNQNNKSVNPLSYINNAKGGKTVYSETTTDAKSSSSSAGYVGKYAKEINAASKSFGVSADLIAAMIKQESNFNARAVSGAGAKGLMQLMPGTARELGVKDPFNVQQNINGGTKYIAQQLKAFGGDVKKALAAYNAGAGNVRKYGGIPPFKETQNYVKKVMANFASYSGKAATSKNVTDTTTTTTPGTSTTSVYKDEAATKEAIEQAESQIIEINGELISVKDHIQQLQMDIVNGQLSYYQDQRERQDRSIAHIEKDIALLDSTSIHYTKTLDDMYKHMAEKQRLNKEEVRYLEKMANSNTLNAAATEELRLKAADLKLEIKDLNLAMSELAMNGFSAHMGRFGERIDDLEYLIEISKAYSSTLSESDPKRGIELGKQVHLMEHQQDLLKRQQVRAEKMLKDTSLTADQHKEIEKTLQGINAEYWSLEQQIRDVNAGIADDVIAQMKEVYTKQKEMALKAIEDERTAYQKMVNDKIKMLDEQAEKEDFLADQKDKQQEMTDLQSKIDLLSLDDSQFAKAERAKLQKELDALDKDYAKFMKDKEREDRRESLEEELENKEEELDKKTEVTETYWDNIINNERKFAKDRENIMKGETTAYVLELERLAKWTEKHSKDMGKAISENIVDNLKEANNLLKNVAPVNDSDKSLANRNKKDGDSVKWESTYRKEDEKKNSKKRKTKSALNLRSGAGVNNKSLVVIPKGKTVEYLDVKTKGWAKVKYDGKTGYVDAKHLQHLETGGYTGDNVPKDGALAVLHKKEQVLNKDDTSNLFKTIDLMNRIHSKMKSFIPPALSGNSSNGNTQIENLVHIENFNGTKKEVDSLASNLISSLGKKGVIITR